jgi:hypothetical protein
MSLTVKNGKGNVPNKGRNLSSEREGYDRIDWSDKRTSYHWMNHPDFEGIDLIDPDGWDRENLEYSFNEEKIDRFEFIHRINNSTCHLSQKTLDKLNVYR